MDNRIKQSVIGGIVGTVIMTVAIMIEPYLGFPEMNPAEMLGGMSGTGMIGGWIMHFMVGIIFALMYAYVFRKMLGKISNNIAKGAVFGIIVLVIAQIAMMGMMMMGQGPPEPEEGMGMMMGAMLINHVTYGIGVALVVKGDD